MPSRDLEKSLREEIEGYVEGRLTTLRDEVARLQDQVNQAFARLSERLSSEGAGDAPVAVAVAEHLRQARNRGIEEAAEGSMRARSSSDIAILKAAVEDLEGQRTQSEILSALVNRAASFAPRVGFFVVKNERITGWRARGLEGTVGDDAVREISLPLSSNTLLSEAARSRRSWSGEPGSHAEDNSIYGHFGGEPPQRIVAIPLTVREKTVAVLYADSAEQDADAVNLEALETLVRVTGMSVELLAVRSPQVSTRETSSAAVAPAPEAETQREPERVEEAPAQEEPVAAPEPEPAAATEPEFVADESSQAALQEPEKVEEPQPAYQTQEAPREAEPSVAQDPWTQRADIATTPVEAPPSQPEPQPASRRRYGADAELPVEVSEEERPVHDRARRFARLLVSEIKLYNEQKVNEGRNARDLYSRLREDIDRSREMYDKRFAEQVGSRYDYFHHELVNTLADGDPSRLGDGYPGASVSA